MRNTGVLIFGIGCLALGACGAPWVESPMLASDVRIRSSEDVEAILELMQQYEYAVESMDLESVRRMVSIDYYENAGTTDATTDDYGFSGVLPMLEAVREHVEEARIDVEVHEIVVDENRAEVLFDFGITMLYRVGENSRWETNRDVARFQLQREETGWMIVSGL